MKIEQPKQNEMKEIREEFGLTQKQAGALVHVTDGAWTRWESGDRKIKLAAWELFLIKIGLVEGGKQV